MLTDAVNDPHAHDSEIVADIVTERLSDWVSEKNNATPQQIKKAREIAKKAKNAETARKAVESGNVKTVEAGGMKAKFSADTALLSAYREPITMQDVEVLRSIGRKSANSFTSADLQKAGKWAYKMYSEMKVKSPFFRSWFGDWRAKDASPIAVASIPAYTATTKSDVRGIATNADTEWNIRISRNGVNNTESHAGIESKSIYGLAGIKELIEKSILLDTEVHEHHANNTVNDSIAFDHKLYALGKDDNGVICLYKITVEDYYQSKKEQSNKRFHNLRYIEKIAELSADALPDKPRSGGSANEKTAIIYNVANLYAFVKQYDKDFTAAKDVSPVLLNENGTPKKVYHGTDANFTVFERGDIGYHVGTKAQAEDRIAGVEGGHIMELYASIQNPLHAAFDFGDWHGQNVAQMLMETEQFEDFDNRAEIEARLSEIAQMKNQQEADTAMRKYLQSLGYDGIVYENNWEGAGDSFIAFESGQLKSATDNIGLFDSQNPDIRFSIDHDLLRETVEAIDKTPLEKNLEKLEKVHNLKGAGLWLLEPSRLFCTSL